MKISRRGFIAGVTASALDAQNSNTLAYIGTYTGAKSKGIYAATYAGGALSGIELAAETPSPSFLALHPNRRFLYAVNEINNYRGGSAGSASAFSIEAGGKLKLLNTVSSGGPGPCHLAVDPSGRCVCVANYAGGSVAVLPVDRGGALREASDFRQHSGSSVNKARQRAAHAHEAAISPDGGFLYVPDLGLDQILIYTLDADRGKLTDRRAVKTPPGSGPRHIAFHPGGHFAYALCEMGGLVVAFHYEEATGGLDPFQTISTLPKDFQGANGSAEIQIHPNGHFLYASNRGPNTIAAFRFDADGALRAIGQTPTQGKTPRDFVIDASGKFLLAANQDSDNIVSFAIGADGMLVPANRVASCASPVCIVFRG